MKTWGFGIIGCGTIADFHMKAISEIDNVKLVAISDRKEVHAKAIAEREQCDWTTNYQELLTRDDIDVISLTTGSGSHAAIGLEVLEAGKHLFVEKPMSMKASEAEALAAKAAEKGLMISVVSQRRFEPQNQQIHQAISQGALGKLLLLEVKTPFYRTQEYYDSSAWRGTIAEDGGALMNQGIHQIDLLLWMGGAVKSVSGKVATQTHAMEAEDIGLGLLQFENGALGTIMSSTSIQPGFAPQLNIYGEKGSIKLEGTEIVHWSVPGIPAPEAGQAVSSGGGVSDPKAISHVYHRLQMVNVVHSLDNNKQPIVTAEDGRRSVAVIEAIYESSSTGQTVNLN